MSKENKTVSPRLTEDYGIMGNKSKMLQELAKQEGIPYVDFMRLREHAERCPSRNFNQPKKEDR